MNALSIFRLSVILPLVGVILGVLIGMWVKEGIAPLIIGAVGGGVVGFRAATASNVLAQARFEILRLWGKAGYPRSLTIMSQAFGAWLIGWLADWDILKYIGVLLGLGILSTIVLNVFGLAVVGILILLEKKMHIAKLPKIAHFLLGITISMPISTYIYYLSWPAICLATSGWFSHQSGEDSDWIYRLIAAWACPYLVSSLSESEYSLATSDKDRELQARIYQRTTMLWLGLFALYAYFPKIPATLYFWWNWPAPIGELIP